MHRAANQRGNLPALSEFRVRRYPGGRDTVQMRTAAAATSQPGEAVAVCDRRPHRLCGHRPLALPRGDEAPGGGGLQQSLGRHLR